MELPLQITLRGFAHSDAIEAAIRERASKLERFHPHIMSCRIVVELPAKHKQRGKEFVVRLDIKVPRGEIAINHDHHKDVFVAVRDAFSAARRKISDHLRRRRGEVKSPRAG